MSDQDNLRDRIAVTLAKAQNADYWTDEITTWEGLEVWQREAYPDEYPAGAYEDRSDYRDAAQAIIDEFGMTVETREIDETRWPDEHVNYRIARVVGKWERQ